VNAARRRWLLGAAVLPLAGCVATPYGAYHRPTSADPGARGVRAWCGGTAGPQTGLEIDVGFGVKVSARTERATAARAEAGLPLRVAIVLPRDRAVRVQPGAVSVRSLGDGVLALAPSLRAYGGAEAGVLDEVDVAPLRPGGRAGVAADAMAPQGWVVLDLQGFEGEPPLAFELAGPGLIADGRRRAFPALTLRRAASRDTIGWYRTSAQLQQLVDRVAACQRETPTRACENTLRHSPASFELDDGLVTWHGEIGALNLATAPQRLRAEILFAVRGAARWRLDGDRFPLRDLDHGRLQTLRAARMRLRFDETLPRDAVVELAASAAATPATLAVDFTLPAGIGDFEVRLPPVQAGDRRLEFAPLRFERRSLDGGIEPFNC
jgi:hypothetical protein